MRPAYSRRACLAAAALAFVVSGCATAGPTTAPTSTQRAIVIGAQGYPLDRTLSGFSNWGALDAAVVVTNIEAVNTFWNTPDGGAPSYVLENRPPSEAEGANPPTILTRYEGVVIETLQGSLSVGSRVSLFASGGTVGPVTLNAGTELAPQATDLIAAGPVLIGGQQVTVNGITGTAIDFAYRLSNGKATTLMESGSNQAAEFTMADARAAFRKPTK